MGMKTLSFVVILIMATAIDASAQSLQEPWEKIIERLERQLCPEYRRISECRNLIERLKTLPERERQEFAETILKLLGSMNDPLRERYLANRSGSRDYCAADYGSAPPSRRPHRWCMYPDMASCLEATRDHNDYACELNQFR